MPAVIFDMDGVLIDSAAAHLHSWRESAAARGYRVDRAVFDGLFGQAFIHWMAALGAGDLTAAEQQDWYRDKEERYRAIVRADAPLMAGGRELIAALAAVGWRCAIGSAGPRENVAMLIDLLDAGAAIGAALSADDVDRPKPAPDVFLACAERLGVAPQDCVVIEDSLHGLEAAGAAGMVRVGLTGTCQAVALAPHCDLVVGSLSEVTPAGLAALLHPTTR